MIPRIPMRGLRSVMSGNLPETDASGRCRTRGGSALTVVIFVSPVERVHLAGGERLRGSERARDVHGAGDVLAHHRGLDRLDGGRADGEYTMAAHEHGR